MRIRLLYLVLELPASERLTKIDLTIDDGWRLRPTLDGLFPALTSLTVKGGFIDGGELTALVCTQCLRLRDLSLELRTVAEPDVFLRSDSLVSLCFLVKGIRQLLIAAPRLEELTVDQASEARISAPNLAKLGWRGHAYDKYRNRFAFHPHLHQFADDVPRHVQSLEVGRTSLVSPLFRRFDEVDELELEILIGHGTEEHESFLGQTSTLPKCKTFSLVLFWSYHHDLVSFVLHLLKSCNNSTGKFSVLIIDLLNRPLSHSCPSNCPCRLEEGRKVLDGVTLSSLEEIEISQFTDCQEKVELVEFLSFNAAAMKKLVINHENSDDPSLTKEVCEKVRHSCRPNVEIEFYDVVRGEKIRFD